MCVCTHSCLLTHHSVDVVLAAPRATPRVYRYQCKGLGGKNAKIVAHAQFRAETCLLCTRACGYGGDHVELL